MRPDPRRALARRGEQLAQEHFDRLGYALVERNHRSRFGEIDLIVFDGSTLVFAEVKTRRRGAGAPFDAIGPAKQRQVRRLARAWLAHASHPWARSVRFDAVGITLGPRGELLRLDHLEAVF